MFSARVLVCAAVLVAALGPLTASADERQTLAGLVQLAAAPIDSHASLARRVLEASGVPAVDWPRYEQQIQQLAEQLRAGGQVIGSQRERAVAIHEFLHQQVLCGGFKPSGANLAEVLDNGPFNCATSSALFLLLAESFGVPAQAVGSPGHVWCRVATESGPFDVETTCAKWFDMTARKTGDPAPNAARILAEHKERVEQSRVLDQSAFVAIFHYNRGVRLLREKNYRAAAEANLSALALDPQCTLARENLLATVNDWALALAAEGDGELGLELLSEGLALAPEYEPFQTNYRFLSEQNGRPAEPRLQNESSGGGVLRRLLSADSSLTSAAF